ncbi:protein YgfX [Kushneria aurantia]|uniref:Protein YgfX n=1 Tax=Kushneria aurantia TaxID=504092 RepID=A0ABV6G7S3_9GAMM|nr:protein YgfX [Kushneria aurantia]
MSALSSQRPAFEASFSASRTATLVQTALVVAIALACMRWLNLWWGLAVVSLMTAFIFHDRKRLPPPLRCMGEGRWECRRHGQWQPITLHLDRLGPWLVELRLDGQRHAIWFDALGEDDFRQLRMALMAHRKAQTSPDNGAVS